MKNIIKSIIYELLHSKFLIRIYIMLLLFMVLVTALNINTGEKKGTSYMLADNPVILYQFGIFLLSIIVGTICGEDYKDKVGNYEILFGHSRRSIYVARTLFACIVSGILCTSLSFVPIITGNIIGQWGNGLSLSHVVIRNLLMIFPYVRLAAFLAMITFIIKNNYIIMASGFFLMMIISVVDAVMENGRSLYLSIFNLGLLTDYQGWNIYNIDPVSGIVEYNSYDSSISTGNIVGTILVSLIMTAFYIFMGYTLFRRDDIS
ncbi:MAG: hypothetical protein K6E10_04735 [Eubacterium sp.]|nr:hypothetical protein [Eubacterium sp.]